ncbi:MAG: hypothetical protein ACAI25_09095 [Planctomycetota bacterium]
MSWSCFWIFSRLPAGSEAQVDALLQAAVDQKLTPEVSAAIQAVERDPELLTDDYDAGNVNRVLMPFARPSVGIDVLNDLDAIVDFTKNSKVHVGLDRVPPFSALFYALGPNRAARLPGRFGNMVIPATRLRAVRDEVSAVFTEDPTGILERARRVFFGTDPWGDAPKLLAVLPKALDDAVEAGTGLVGFGHSV